MTCGACATILSYTRERGKSPCHFPPKTYNGFGADERWLGDESRLCWTGLFTWGHVPQMMHNPEGNTSDCDLTEVFQTIKSKLKSTMAHPNLFFLSRDGAASGATAVALCKRLRREFFLAAFEVSLPGQDGTEGSAEHLCIVIDCSQPERVRDAIKEQLWLARPEPDVGPMLDAILRGRHKKPAREFRLEEYGMFVPCRKRKHTDIRTHSFAHSPAYYRYRLAQARTDHLPEPMADYLHALFTDCPNHLFSQNLCRASRVARGGLGVEIALTRLKDHDIIALAARSRGFDEVSSRHENLQRFFLDHNPNTIACEVPVWAEAWEFEDYRRLLGTRESLTGHIDVLRLEDDGLLGVWDYKPRAAAERSAHLQVFLYALMLALRTGLPMSAFLCGYFDEKDAYIFRPSEVKVAHES